MIDGEEEGEDWKEEEGMMEWDTPILSGTEGVAHWSVMTFSVRSVYRDCRVLQNLGGAW